MGIKKENKCNNETNMVNNKNSPRGFKHFEMSILKCLLCVHEKLYIATYHDQEELLNKWLELI